MLFNSFEFLIFFCTVTTAFFVIPFRFRWVLLLLASYYFYMCWNPRYVVLIILSTLCNYIFGLLIEASQNAFRRKTVFWIALALNICFIAGFKYAAFLSESIVKALMCFNLLITIPHSTILAPIGISFYTFTSVGYLIDVYTGKVPAEKHPGIFAVFVSFFPQVLAGPIERSRNMMHQYTMPTRFTYQNTRTGLLWIVWGLCKKVVIADLLVGVVNTVYEDPHLFSGPVLAIGILFFSIQIYCDFSGYSDMAKGIAKILGYDIMINFKQPYLSKSIGEFWKRWHISLSSWFRDYLYIPLGGNRVSVARWCFNLLLAFGLSGLWHGAHWKFVVWGLYHGVLALASRLTARVYTNLTGISGKQGRVACIINAIQPLIVIIPVFLGWNLFRAESLSDAICVFTHIFTFTGFNISQLWELGLPRFEMIVAFLLIPALFLVDAMLYYDWSIKRILWNNTRLRYLAYCICFYAIVFFGVFKKVNFIYFQF